MIKKSLFLCGVLTLTGCATVLDPNSASSSFSCAKSDKDVYETGGPVVCKTPMAVYKSTDGGIPRSNSDVPVRVDSTYPEQLAQALSGGSGTSQAQAKNSPAAGLTYYEPGNLYGQNSPQFAAPVRTPATVMRVWFAPWVDRKDDLHLGQYVFTEIEPRKWSLGAKEFMGSGVAVPTKQFQNIPSGQVRQNNEKAVQGQQTNGAAVPLPETELPEL